MHFSLPIHSIVVDLRKQAWKKIEPFYLARLEELTEKFSLAQSHQLGAGDLSDIAKAAVSDEVATLLVEADRLIPGTLDRTTGAVRSADSPASHVDDMFDDLAELVNGQRGRSYRRSDRTDANGFGLGCDLSVLRGTI